MFVDLGKMTTEITEIGGINLKFLQGLQKNWLDGLVSASNKATAGQVKSVIESMKNLTKVLIGLPTL
jgi:hypothetical protein